MTMPPDFTANPLRTRDDVQQLVRDLVAPVMPHSSPGRALVTLGANRALYGDPAGLLEGFARPLWGLIPLGAGGGAFEHWEIWRQGLDAGTNPDHPEFWGWPGDFDQRSVECGALGFSLALLPREVWATLSPVTQERVATWLRKVNEVQLVDSNWLFFRVLVNLGLERCGRAFSRERVQADLDRIDHFYLGDGWYKDGISAPPFRNGRIGDYYVPMAMHFYALIYAHVKGKVDPVRAANYQERARLFASDFIHWFSADGSALPFGRSLTYHFAQGAFWGALAFANVEALPWPVIKGIYLSHLRWWLRQPIFSETGLITIGYAYPNLLMAESYNSSASPYWGLKVFLPLALPENHPFWTAEEAPLPPRPAVRTVAEAGLVMTTDPTTRGVMALNAGQPVEDWPRHAPHKYSKFAYSTRFGFCVPTSSATLAEGGFDSMLALSDDDRRYRIREHCYEPEVCEGVAYSRWLPWPDVEVKTWLIAAGDTCHVRVHQVKTARKLWSAETGFAAGYALRNSLVTSPRTPNYAEVRTARDRSQLTNLSETREGDCAELGANSHVLASLSAMPVLRAEHKSGEHWLASVASGGDNNSDGSAVAAQFTFHLNDGVCEVKRAGARWWGLNGAACGESSPERLQSLSQMV